MKRLLHVHVTWMLVVGFGFGSPPSSAGAAPAALESIDLTGPPEALASAVGLPPNTPRARLLVDVVRLAHALPSPRDGPSGAARAGLARWLHEPLDARPPAATGAATGNRAVPSPLPEATWRDLAAELGAEDGPVVRLILGDRRLSLLYVGLLGCSADSLEFFRAHPALLADILRSTPGAFAAFGRSLTVKDGRMRLPGGPALDRTWQELAGASPGEPERFVRAALGSRGGRLAWFIDVVARLPLPAQRFALAETAGTETSASRVAALADVFAGHAEDWRVEERPFARPAVDGAIVLSSLVWTPQGAWIGPPRREFWEDVFARRDRDREAGTASGLAAMFRMVSRLGRSGDEREGVDAPWLLRSVLVPDAAEASARLAAIRFVQRRFAAATDRELPDVRASAVGMLDQPALMLVLERMGVSSPAAFAAARARALRLSADARGPEGDLAVAQFQAALALVDALCRRHALPHDRVGPVLDRLLQLEPSASGYGPALTTWLTGMLAPALPGHTDAASGIDAQVLTALAGSPAAPTAPTITWEGLTYHVDHSHAERRRLVRLLQRQRAPGLRDAIDLWTAIDALQRAESRPSRAAAIEALDTATGTIGAVRPALFVRESGAVPLSTVTVPLIERLRRDEDGHSSSRELSALARVADSVLCEALVTLVYAVDLGDPDGPVTLVPEIARRHAFDAADRMTSPALSGWQLPVQRFRPAGGWHVAGSLLALDHALGSLGLRSSQTGEMPGSPRLAEAGQQLIAHTVTIMDGAQLDDETQDRLVRAVEQGRGRLDTWCDRAQPEAIASWSAWMRAVARWACVADRASFRALWTLTDAFWAGESSMPRDTRLDPWGGLDVDAEGPLATRWPAATPRDELMGRPATGRIASRFVELTLRAALVTRRHRLPAAILPDVLRRAAFDLLHEAPLAEPDDWYRLARFAADMGDDQIEDYIAALAADGPLVATAASDRP